jgi:hypothetical protein
MALVILNLDFLITSAGSKTITLLAPNFDVNLAANEHPPAPPPTTSTLHLLRNRLRISICNKFQYNRDAKIKFDTIPEIFLRLLTELSVFL